MLMYCRFDLFVWDIENYWPSFEVQMTARTLVDMLNVWHWHLRSILASILRFYFIRKIKIWDLAAALDPRAPTNTLCLRTLVVSEDSSC
jgi:hypothetical protein